MPQTSTATTMEKAIAMGKAITVGKGSMAVQEMTEDVQITSAAQEMAADVQGNSGSGRDLANYVRDATGLRRGIPQIMQGILLHNKRLLRHRKPPSQFAAAPSRGHPQRQTHPQ